MSNSTTSVTRYVAPKGKYCFNLFRAGHMRDVGSRQTLSKEPKTGTTVETWPVEDKLFLTCRLR